MYGYLAWHLNLRDVILNRSANSKHQTRCKVHAASQSLALHIAKLSKPPQMIDQARMS